MPKVEQKKPILSSPDPCAAAAEVLYGTRSRAFQGGFPKPSLRHNLNPPRGGLRDRPGDHVSFESLTHTLSSMESRDAAVDFVIRSFTGIEHRNSEGTLFPTDSSDPCGRSFRPIQNPVLDPVLDYCGGIPNRYIPTCPC